MISTFEKVYTRDTTIIMQELWGRSCTEGVRKSFEIKNPYRPEIIHFMNDGSIEIWENKIATRHLMDAILRKNRDASFLVNILAELKNHFDDLSSLWRLGHLERLSDLRAYVEKAAVVVTNFVPYYYSAVDERTPSNLRDKALAFRNNDIFFSSSDNLIRNTLTHCYPKMEGLETTICSGEIMSLPLMSELKMRRVHMTLVDGVERTTETLADLSKRRPELKFALEKGGYVARQVKGRVAFGGVVKGVVRILRRKDQIGYVGRGEIIVSPMTTPDFLPAMQKAAAFVTDEGGITCHAAIVARELKKPCIIGTKIATKVLKDGDIVEVNADTGTVKIIKTRSRDQQAEGQR